MKENAEQREYISKLELANERMFDNFNKMCDLANKLMDEKISRMKGHD